MTGCGKRDQKVRKTGDLIYGWPLVFKSPHYVHIDEHVLGCNINVLFEFYFIDREKNPLNCGVGSFKKST